MQRELRHHLNGSGVLVAQSALGRKGLGWTSLVSACVHNPEPGRCSPDSAAKQLLVNENLAVPTLAWHSCCSLTNLKSRRRYSSLQKNPNRNYC
jgi:hypothetical protein